MDKILTHDYLELIGLLTTITNDSSLNRQFKINIRKVHNTLSDNSRFRELYEYMTETSPNLATCLDTVDFVSNNELCQLFVEWILFLLEFLSLSLTKAMRQHHRSCKYDSTFSMSSYSPDSLSSIEKRIIHNSLDFVFILGISPQLLPGIYETQKSSLIYQKIMSSFRALPNQNKNVELLKKSLNMMVELFELKLSIIFKEYIIAEHFHCYLMALFHVCYCPSTIESAWCTNRELGENDSKKCEEIERYHNYLKNLIDVSPRKFIFRELTYLLGNSSQASGVKNPLWLTETSGLFVRDCIMKEEGVKSFILSFVEDDPDQITTGNGAQNPQKPASIDWEKCGLVSRIITNCPLGDFSEELYCSSVLEQIQKLIMTFYYADGSSNGYHRPQNKSIVPVLVHTMSILWRDHPVIFCKKIMQHLAAPLYTCTQELSKVAAALHQSDGESFEVVSEQHFSICIETFYEILIIFRLPMSKLSQCLLPFVNVLFELHLYTSANPTYLSSSVEALLLEVLNNMDTDQSLSLLKYFSDLENFDSSLFIGWKVLRFLNKDCQFSSGITGGVRVVLKPSPPRFCAKFKEISSFKSVESKASILVDLITRMDRREIPKGLCLSCLQSLTRIIFHDMASEAKIQWTINYQWLVMLGGILEKGGEFCCDCVEEIFLFSKVVLEKTLTSLTHTYNDLYEETFQHEALVLVMALLSSFILEHEDYQMSNFIVHLARDMVSPLKCLQSSHPNSDIKTLAFQLVRTITTHIQNRVVNCDRRTPRIMTRHQVKQYLDWMKQRNLLRNIQALEKKTSLPMHSCNPLADDLGSDEFKIPENSDSSYELFEDDTMPVSGGQGEGTEPFFKPRPDRSRSARSDLRSEPSRTKTVRFSDVIDADGAER